MTDMAIFMLTAWESGNFGMVSSWMVVTGSAGVIGNVGIGTTSPNAKLVVVGGVNITGGMNMTGDLFTDGNINATGNITSGTGTVFIDGTNSRIGIGTSSPAYTLDVQGSMKVSQNMTVGDNVMFENGEVLAINGKTNLTTLATVNDVFVYDTSKDSDGGAWTCDERAKTTSWYNETLNTAQRGKTRCFPKRAILVVTDNNLTIHDASDNSLWMVFDEGASYALHTGTHNVVFALNSKAYVGSSNNLTVIDFANDQFRKYDDTNDYSSTDMISERNSALTLAAGPNTPIVNASVNDVHANIIEGKTYVAVATDGGVSIICEECNNSVGTVVDAATSGRSAKSVALAQDGALYVEYSNDADPTMSIIYSRYNIHKITSDFSIGNSYDGAYGGGAGSGGNFLNNALFDFTTGADQINDIIVTDGTSTVDGKSNTIYVATTSGLSVIQERQGNESLGSVKYYTANYTSEEMIGDIRGYWNMETVNASGNLTDLSVNSNNGIPNGTTIGGVLGVRGNATYFDGVDDKITFPDNADWEFGSGDLAISYWVYFESATDMSLFQYQNSGSWYAFFSSTNRLEYQSNQVAYNMATGLGLNQNQWYHIAFVKSGGTLNSYIDGVFKGSIGIPAIPNPSTDFHMGVAQAFLISKVR